MLNPGLNRQALTRRSLVATTIVLLGITLPVAAFRATAQNAPLTLSGTVYDASGAVLPGVNLTLEDAQQVKSHATTDSSGRFEFASISPGRYVLNASLAGFRSLRHEFERNFRERGSFILGKQIRRAAINLDAACSAQIRFRKSAAQYSDGAHVQTGGGDGIIGCVTDHDRFIFVYV